MTYDRAICAKIIEDMSYTKGGDETCGYSVETMREQARLLRAAAQIGRARA